MSKQYDYLYKVIVIGDSDTGKSSLSQRIAIDSFNPTHIRTIGVEFLSHKIKISGKIIKLQIWDTAGADHFRSVTKAYYKGSRIIFLVYDVTNLNSFKNIKKWISQIKEELSNKILYMASSHKLRIEMGRSAREKANTFNKDTILQNWIILFNNITKWKNNSR